jgi:hypothetical protein
VPFTHLLLTACLIQFHDVHQLRRIEIGRRVIEGQVAVLANPDTGHIYRPSPQHRSIPPALLFWVGRVTLQKMHGPKRQVLKKPLS